MVEKRDTETIRALFHRFVLPGSIVNTDYWKAYNFIDEEDSGYIHKKVNHSKEYKSD